MLAMGDGENNTVKKEIEKEKEKVADWNEV